MGLSISKTLPSELVVTYARPVAFEYQVEGNHGSISVYEYATKRGRYRGSSPNGVRCEVKFTEEEKNAILAVLYQALSRTEYPDAVISDPDPEREEYEAELAAATEPEIADVPIEPEAVVEETLV